MVMLDNKLCLTSVVEFLRRGRVDRGTIEGKVVVVVDSSKRKVHYASPTCHGSIVPFQGIFLIP
jgi:hypothetical protein